MLIEFSRIQTLTHPFQIEELESLVIYCSEPHLYFSFWFPSFSRPTNKKELRVYVIGKIWLYGKQKPIPLSRRDK